MESISGWGGSAPRETYPVLFQRPDGAIWLEKRPPTGIWGGLHCFPEIGHRDELETHTLANSKDLHIIELASIEHIFSHFKLLMKPLLVSIQAPLQVAESNGVWYDPAFPAQVGIARPVERILSTLLAEAPISK